MFNKNELIRVHKMIAKEDLGTAGFGTMQLMGAGLKEGAFTPQDCADIISAVFDEEAHMLNMLMTEILSD